MIVVVGGLKGGSGKTTLATNLVVMRALQGKKNVLFVDADEMSGSYEWVQQREGLGIKLLWITKKLAGKTIYQDLKSLAHEYDEIIVDVGGRDTTSQRASLMAADIFLTPFRPRTPDLWTLDKLQEMILPIKQINQNLRCIPCINQGDVLGKDNEDSLKIISDYPFLAKKQIIINQRKSFHNAYAQGLGVIELKKPDQKAIYEMEYLYHSIYK